ncbi:uncharacterized protein LOC127010711 [Drosophila biarmipes]|uniref:uncharacterized protein LOC127010711 n=1 Tax=Drosophila biarmipes TaxID=125945 RepID=UPI0021CC5E5C|nr:uncharacterized protein LOC127010711 [Drosophila biarmipes]
MDKSMHPEQGPTSTRLALITVTSRVAQFGRDNHLLFDLHISRMWTRIPKQPGSQTTGMAGSQSARMSGHQDIRKPGGPGPQKPSTLRSSGRTLQFPGASQWPPDIVDSRRCRWRFRCRYAWR